MIYLIPLLPTFFFLAIYRIGIRGRNDNLTEKMENEIKTRRKPGSKPKVLDSEIIDVLSKLEIFDNGSLKMHKSYVWKQACNLMHDKVQSVTLYLRVLRDQRLLKILKEMHNVPDSSSIEIENDAIQDTIKNDTIQDTRPNFPNCDNEWIPHSVTKDVKPGLVHILKRKRINFDLTISKKEWLRIKPVKRKYKNNKIYTVFKKNWSDFITKKIRKSAYELPCAIMFRKHQFLANGGFYFYGDCKEKKVSYKGKIFKCGNRIYGQLRTFTKESLLINITFLDARKIPHKKKRHLKGERRLQAQKAMNVHKMKGAQFREQQSRKMMKYGEREPPDLNSSNTYRKAKQEYTARKYGFVKGENALTSLRRLSSENNACQKLTLKPFSCIYQTPHQISLVRNIASTQALRFNIDASGNFPHPLKVKNDTTGHIFLYVIITWFEGYRKIIPVSQMLSESHTATKITDWLQHCSCSLGLLPSECITDGSPALVNAVSLAFNNCTFRETLEVNHKFLIGKSSELKHCFMRDDRNHFIKAFTEIKCWKIGNNECKKEFYTRCLGYCMGIFTIELIKETFEHVFIVCLSEFCVEASECKKSIDWLVNKMSNFDVERYKNIINETSEQIEAFNYLDVEESSPLDSDSILDKFIDGIIDTATKKSCTETDLKESYPNPYYCKELLRHLRKTCLRYTTWTNVLVDPYQSQQEKALSVRSESYFNILKKDLERMTVPAFIIEHLKKIDGEIILAKAAFDNIYKIIPGDLCKERNEHRGKHYHKILGYFECDKQQHFIVIQC